MINFPSYQPYVISPLNMDNREVLLENGQIRVKARLLDGIYFDSAYPCLAIVDCEMLSKGLVISDLNLLAVNVEPQKICRWLSGLKGSLRDSFAGVIALVTLIHDESLRSCVLDVIFNESLNPNKLFNYQSPSDIERLYPFVLTIGEYVWHRCNEFPCSQHEKDMILTMSILQEIVQNKALNMRFKSEQFGTVNDLVIYELMKLSSVNSTNYFITFYKLMSPISSGIKFTNFLDSSAFSGKLQVSVLDYLYCWRYKISA